MAFLDIKAGMSKVSWVNGAEPKSNLPMILEKHKLSSFVSGCSPRQPSAL